MQAGDLAPADAPARLGPADGKAMGGTGGSPVNSQPEAPASAAERDLMDASPVRQLPAPLNGEILPPAPLGDVDPTRTAMKRAMRRAAQEFAEEALQRLAQAMRNLDDRIAVPAANAILDRAHGKPTSEIEVEAGGLSVVILKFGDTPL
jgi:hypothetical protein